MNLFIINAVFAVFVAPTAMTEQDGDGEEEALLMDRVRSDYPSALARLESFYTQVRGNGTLTTTVQSEASSVRIIRSDPSFALDGRSQKHSRTLTDESPERTGTISEVICRTPEYAFKLNRKSADDPYVLVGFEEGPEAGADSAIDSVVLEFLEAPFSIANLPVRELMSRPDFRMTGISKVEQGVGERLKIDFESIASPSTFLAGSIIVAPEDGWVIHEAKYYYTARRHREFTTKIRYDESVEGVPVPSRVEHQAPNGVRQVFEFAEISHGPTPAREFTLAYYGLPEIGETGREISKNSGIYWFLGLALGSLIIAIVLKYGATRLRRIENSE